MGKGVEFAGDTHGHFNLTSGVHAGVSFLVEALNTISTVALVTFALEDISEPAEFSFEQTFGIVITAWNVSAVSKNRVTILFVPSILTPGAKLAVRPIRISWATLIPII